jgi:hypothetical protein
MTELETWIKQATRHLSAQSVARVRREIQDHYESAREAAIAGGARANEAERSALKALGDARTANCQYRNVLLTSAEARLLGEGKLGADYLLPLVVEVAASCSARSRAGRRCSFALP